MPCCQALCLMQDDTYRGIGTSTEAEQGHSNSTHDRAPARAKASLCAGGRNKDQAIENIVLSA